MRFLINSAREIFNKKSSKIKRLMFKTKLLMLKTLIVWFFSSYNNWEYFILALSDNS